MSLTSILLIATAILCLLTGFMSLVGVSKDMRGRQVWFFVTTIGCALWTAGIGIFQALGPNDLDKVKLPFYAIYLGSLLMAVSILGYASWRRTWGKIYTVICGLVAVFLAVVLILDPGLLYTDITLSNNGNSVQLYWGWYYITYCLFYVVNNTGFVINQYLNAKTNRKKNARKGDYLLFFGLLISGVLSIVFDLLIPPMDYSLIWVGPLSLCVVMIAFFYSTLKYRLVSMSSRWLQVLAYGVILSIGAVIYMLLFYIIFTALFKIPNPSTSVLVLNFLMIIIVLLLMPVISEVTASVKSMISVGQVDIAYVIKKLNHLATKNVDLRDLAGFLADHLHFAYIGFVVNGRLYGSTALAISAEEIAKITHLRSTANGTWQEPNKSVQKIFDEHNLRAVAELRNAKGKPFGQIIVGKPLGKSSFSRRDLIQLEMIINLVATVIDSEKHLRA